MTGGQPEALLVFADPEILSNLCKKNHTKKCVKDITLKTMAAKGKIVIPTECLPGLDGGGGAGLFGAAIILFYQFCSILFLEES